MSGAPVVFLGPSLPLEEATSLLAAEYRGPVAQGDVLLAVERDPTAIVIIDGYFELVPAVWHKEILVALDRGIPVFGASSMGALRAAELHPFGMVGVGRVFEWFRDGVLVDDDEVAILHGPADDGHRALSDAMVDIRAAVADATLHDVVDAVAASELLALAKSLHYTERSFTGVRHATRGTELEPAAEALQQHARRHGPWQKARDARSVLRVVADDLAAGTLPRPALPEPLHQTVFLEMLRNEASQREVQAVTPSAGAFPLPEPVEIARKKVLLRRLVRAEAARRGLVVSSQEMQQSADEFRYEHGLLSLEQFHDWFGRAGLDEASFVRFLEDRCLSEKLERLLRHDIERELDAQLRLSTARLWSEEQSEEQTKD